MPGINPRGHSDWPFITRSDFDRFLTGLVETEGEGGIAGYCVDVGEGVIWLQIRHRLRNFMRPARCMAIDETLHEAINRGKMFGVQVGVVSSFTPLWLRPNAAKKDPR